MALVARKIAIIETMVFILDLFLVVFGFQLSSLAFTSFQKKKVVGIAKKVWGVEKKRPEPIPGLRLAREKPAESRR